MIYVSNVSETYKVAEVLHGLGVVEHGLTQLTLHHRHLNTTDTQPTHEYE
jgi:hypothetical protein